MTCVTFCNAVGRPVSRMAPQFERSAWGALGWGAYAVERGIAKAAVELLKDESGVIRPEPFSTLRGKV